MINNSFNIEHDSINNGNIRIVLKHSYVVGNVVNTAIKYFHVHLFQNQNIHSKVIL